MKSRILYITLFLLLGLGFILLKAYTPIKSFVSKPSPWHGNNMVKSDLPHYDSTKNTVFIIADHRLTEMFDMLAPFYLFNATNKANVYIVAKENTPILIKNHLFVCPQLTFSEADSMQLPADVLVIPALSARDEHQDTAITAWIKRHFSPKTKMLTICDGASTGAATGLYDGKIITCHATDYNAVKSHFSKPLWIQNVSVAKTGNLLSTAGVSNAVEGSLTVIKELFGPETSRQVAVDIHYPYDEIKLAHLSVALNGSDISAAVKKVFLKSNKDIGILLENGINELTMATILDTYSRTFPASFRTYILHDSAIKTKYGLSIIYTGNHDVKGLDELHLAMPESFSAEDSMFFRNIPTVRYDSLQKQYLFNICLKRIAGQYGQGFAIFVKTSLDYNSNL